MVDQLGNGLGRDLFCRVARLPHDILVELFDLETLRKAEIEQLCGPVCTRFARGLDMTSVKGLVFDPEGANEDF